MSKEPNDSDYFCDPAEIQRRVELICDLTRKIELLDALMAAAREKRSHDRQTSLNGLQRSGAPSAI